MTRAIVKSRYGVSAREMDLADALAPYYSGDSGVAEEALYTARDLERIIGRLLAAMVDGHVITLMQAQDVIGSYDAMEIVK